jgi:hypothetical protein
MVKKKETKKGVGGKQGQPKREKKMPPLRNWNPILLRLYEKATEFDMQTYQNEVAKIIGISEHNLGSWMRGASISQQNMELLARYLKSQKFSDPEIVYVFFGQNVSESGAFRILNDYQERPKKVEDDANKQE